MRGKWFLGSVLLLFVLGASSAAAQTDVAGPPGGVDELLGVARDSMLTWIDRLMPFAWRLFLGGGVIELTWSLGRAKLRGELEAVVEALIAFLLRKGFWAFILGNVRTIAPAVILSFQQAGRAAATADGQGVSPQMLVNELVKFAGVQSEGLSLLNPIRSMEVMAAVSIVFLAFGCCALIGWFGWFLGYFVAGGGCLLLGFAGTSWTEDIAKRYLQALLAAGVHLQMLELENGLFFGYLQKWVVWAQTDQYFGLVTALKMGLCGLVILASLFLIPILVSALAYGHLSTAMDAVIVGAAAKAATWAVGQATAAFGKVGEKIVDAVKDAATAGGGSTSGSAGTPAASPIGVEVVGGPSANAIAAFEGGDSPRLASGRGGDGGESGGPGGGGRGPRHGGGGWAGGSGSAEPPGSRRPGLLLGPGEGRTVWSLLDDDEGSP